MACINAKEINDAKQIIKETREGNEPESIQNRVYLLREIHQSGDSPKYYFLVVCNIHGTGIPVGPYRDLSDFEKIVEKKIIDLKKEGKEVIDWTNR